MEPEVVTKLGFQEGADGRAVLTAAEAGRQRFVETVVLVVRELVAAS